MGWKERATPANESSDWKSRAVPEESKDKEPGYGRASTMLQGLGQAGTFGYLPELQALAAGPLQSIYETVTGEDLGAEEPFDERLKGFRGRNVQMQTERPGDYLMGNIAGAVGTAPLIAGKALQGASALQKIGQAAKLGAAQGFIYNPHSESTDSDMSLDLGGRTGQAILGGFLSGGTQGLLSGAEGLLKAVPKAVSVLDDAGASPQMKQNASEIIEAAEKLKTKATPGMLYDSPVLGGLESSLEQSPGLAARGVRKSVDSVRNATKDAADDLLKDASSLSAFEAGQKVKGDMLAKIGEDLAPHQMAFDELRAATKDIELFPKGSAGRDSRAIISRNILKIPEVQALPNSPWSSEAKQVAEAIAQAKTTQDLTIIRQSVGKEFQDATGVRKYVLGQIYDKLGSFEENSIKRGAIASARTSGEGNKVAREMIGQMRTAKKGYADVASKLREFGELTNIKDTKSPTQAVKAIDKMRSEDLIKRLSNSNDIRMLSAMKAQYPEQFEVVRQRKLAELAEKSLGKNGTDIGKFINATKSLSKEAKLLFFGSPENVERYEAIKTLWRAAPEKMGPSGTPQGQMFRSLLEPMFQIQEFGRRTLYNKLSNPSGQQQLGRVLDRLKSIEPAAKKASGLIYPLSNRPGLVPSVTERSRR